MPLCSFAFQTFRGLGTFRGSDDLLAQRLFLPKQLRSFFYFLYFFLFISLLFTFGLNESIGISLCTGKIHCLPGAREKAESRVTNRSEGMFVSASLFLGARDSVAIH